MLCHGQTSVFLSVQSLEPQLPLSPQILQSYGALGGCCPRHRHSAPCSVSAATVHRGDRVLDNGRHGTVWSWRPSCTHVARTPPDGPSYCFSVIATRICRAPTTLSLQLRERCYVFQFQYSTRHDIHADDDPGPRRLVGWSCLQRSTGAPLSPNYQAYDELDGTRHRLVAPSSSCKTLNWFPRELGSIGQG